MSNTTLIATSSQLKSEYGWFANNLRETEMTKAWQPCLWYKQKKPIRNLLVVMTSHQNQELKPVFLPLTNHPFCLSQLLSHIKVEITSRLHNKAHLKSSDILSFLLEARLVSDRLAPVSSLQAWNECLGSTFALSSPVRDWERWRSLRCSSERDTQNNITTPFISLEIFTLNTQIPQTLIS